ncbi:hypothetical protein I350_06151 [Cryptococcus amylolentus CBS 6273]|uniref:C2H2-type domain-containing protein n=1 Tax=Cryptococcus amylolentus CBS 6273 TaxID=1296118 RepID=A0A1E3JQZ9_9TREE|nr:hypothetical protein I350_06151 [Cryptococcus amylolentus CBS 6273]
MSERAASEAVPETSPRPGFTRGGFAPIPHRHSDIPPAPVEAASIAALSPKIDQEDWERGRGGRERELPRRELDHEPEEREGVRGGRREWDDLPPRRGSWDGDYDRPKRRRSPSPINLPHRRPRLASPSPPPPHHRYLPDPASIETLLPFRAFAEWFRSSHPQTARQDEEETRLHLERIDRGELNGEEGKEKVGMAKRYERYRREFTSRQLYALFLTHRDSVWFKEKYLHYPEHTALRRRVNRQGRVPLVEAYITALRSGARDDVSYDPDGNGLLLDGVKVDVEEGSGMAKVLEGKSDWGEEESVKAEIQPRTKQIFLKTVPPGTSRKSLEELFGRVPGFLWLALSDVSVKRSFHRVAWAQYAESTDVSEVIDKLEGSKLDNFAFHMNINVTPTVGRVRVAPPAVNSLEKLLHDGETAKLFALRLEEELVGDEEEEEKKEGDGKDEKAEKAAEEEKEKKDVAEAKGLTERGSDVVEEVIMRVLELKGLQGEDLDPAQSIQRAKIILDHWISYLRNGLSTCFYCVCPASFPEELHRKCVGHIRSHLDPSPKVEENGHEEGGDVKDEGGEKIEVDVKVEVKGEKDEVKEEVKEEKEDVKEGNEDREMRDAEDPSTSNPARPSDSHDRWEKDKFDKSQSRSKRHFPQKTASEKWLESHSHRLFPLISTDVHLADYGGRDVEEETKKICAPLIKQEEESKYRCKECNKLFKAPEYVMKHVTSKHPEITERRIDDVLYLNNYVLDPQHLQPNVSSLAAVNDKLPTGIPHHSASSLPLPVYPDSIAQPLPNMPPHMNPNGTHQGHGQFNVMQQQMMMMMQMQMQQAMMMGMGGMVPSPGGPGGHGHGDRGGMPGRGGGYTAPVNVAPLPPPPPGGEDPRAKRGRVSYQDLDEPGAGGGGGLPY